MRLTTALVRVYTKELENAIHHIIISSPPEDSLVTFDSPKPNEESSWILIKQTIIHNYQKAFTQPMRQTPLPLQHDCRTGLVLGQKTRHCERSEAVFL